MKRFFVLLFSIFLTSCTGQPSKIKGVSFVGAPTEITATNVAPVVQVNANWAAVMPFSFVKSLDSPNITFDIEEQWWGERREGVKKTIELLNQQKIQVMLKPQIWVWKGEFTGTIKMTTKKN